MVWPSPACEERMRKEHDPFPEAWKQAAKTAAGLRSVGPFRFRLHYDPSWRWYFCSCGAVERAGTRGQRVPIWALALTSSVPEAHRFVFLDGVFLSQKWGLHIEHAVL